MIRMSFANCKWGIDPVIPEEGAPAQGIQINLFDEASQILAQIPFSGDSFPALIAQASQHLTDEQKKDLAPLFETSGIVLPGPGALGPDGKPVTRGPQG